MNLALKAFNQLTNKQKDVWRLVMQECKTEYAAADLLGITRDAVHDRINKAKRRYKKFIRALK
jgi:DNA-directed RNA polymerase specialized sigma24 family protein